MRTALLIASTAAALLTVTTAASAQYWNDNPPGWRFQNRENRESNGQEPYRYRHYRSYDNDYAYAPGATVVVPGPRYYDPGYGYDRGYYGPSVGFGFRVR